jgi:hypothetical protein
MPELRFGQDEAPWFGGLSPAERGLRGAQEQKDLLLRDAFSGAQGRLARRERSKGLWSPVPRGCYARRLLAARIVKDCPAGCSARDALPAAKGVR